MGIGRRASTAQRAGRLAGASMVGALATTAFATLLMAGPTAAAAAAAPTPQLAVTGPVYPGNAPDPSVLVVRGTYYAYTTDDGGQNIPLLESPDGVHWHAVGDVLETLPPWVEAGDTWSPSVDAAPGGGYQLFFDAFDDADGVQCIGRATSPAPDGPFVDTSSTPFLCQPALGGSIDASIYHQRGGDVLVWKSNGTVGIWAQRLDADDSRPVGQPVLLLSPSASWEDGVVEGPTLVRLGDSLTLWFSAGLWTGSGYSVGMAVCSSALGPCDAASATPELTSSAGLTGPGGPAFFRMDGHLELAFAAWVGDVRSLYLAAVSTAPVSAG